MTTPSEKGLSRLLYQFENSTNFRAFIEAFLVQADDLATTAEQLKTLRYLDTATGVQLDGIGEIVGIERPVGYDDATYLYLIKVKILANSTDMSCDNFMELVSFVFGVLNVLYTLTVNLSPKFTVTGTIPTEAFVAFALLPNTLGVGITYQWVPDPDEAFSFYEDSTGKGFGTLTYPTQGGIFSILI